MPVCSSCGDIYSKKNYSTNQLKKKKCKNCLLKSFCEHLSQTISFNAATKIQAVIRGMIFRKNMIFFNAATKIQSVVRGMISRKLNDNSSDCSSDYWVRRNRFNGNVSLHLPLQRLVLALCMNDRLIQNKKSNGIDWKNIPIELIKSISTKLLQIQSNHPIVLQLAKLLQIQSNYPIVFQLANLNKTVPKDFKPCSKKDTTVQQYIQYAIHFNLAIDKVSFQDVKKYRIDDSIIFKQMNVKYDYRDIDKLIYVCKRHRNRYIARTDFESRDRDDPRDKDESKCYKNMRGNCNNEMFYDKYDRASCRCGDSRWYLSDEPDNTFDISDREAQGEHIGYSRFCSSLDR